MKKQTAYLVFGTLFAFWSFGASVWGQTTQMKAQTAAQKPAKVLQAEALRNFRPSLFPESIKEASGMGNVNTNTLTGEAWAMAMFDTPSGTPKANAGFKSNSLQNTGTTDWTGVTVTGSFHALKHEGSIYENVTVEENTGGGWTVCAQKRGILYGNPWDVTTPPFTMRPGANYRGTAWFECGGTNVNDRGLANSCYGKITSIKFNFP